METYEEVIRHLKENFRNRPTPHLAAVVVTTLAPVEHGWECQYEGLFYMLVSPSFFALLKHETTRQQPPPLFADVIMGETGHVMGVPVLEDDALAAKIIAAVAEQATQKPAFGLRWGMGQWGLG